MKSSILWTAALVSIVGFAQADAPKGFTTICTLDESCAVDASTLVAFGQGETFNYRTLTGNFVCSAKTFGVVEKINSNATCLTLQSDITSATSSSSSSGVPPDNKANPFTQLSSGIYAIVSRSSGKALAIDSASTEDGALLTQQDFTESPHQLWRIENLGTGFYSVSALHSGKSLESRDLYNRDGARLQQLSWMNSWDQHWIIQEVNGGYFRIDSRYTSQTLDVYEMNQRENGPVCLWTYWGGDNQQWRLLPIAIVSPPTTSTK